MFRAPHIISGWEWFPVFDWRGKPTYHKHLKRSLPSEIGMWEGLCVFCLKWTGPRDALTQMKAGFPCRGFMHAHRLYHKMKGKLIWSYQLPYELRTLICPLWMQKQSKVNNLPQVIANKAEAGWKHKRPACTDWDPCAQIPLPFSLTKHLSWVFGLFTAIVSQWTL